MRRFPDRTVVAANVTPALLLENRSNRRVYLDLDLERIRAAGMDRRLGSALPQISLEERRPVAYGRVYRERVFFPTDGGEERVLNLTFLKYLIVFQSSGLAADLPWSARVLLRLSSMDREDWHELDNFVAVHLVLNEEEVPMAVILAQHNHHRTYLIGEGVPRPPDGRMSFDLARSSNEIYLSSDSPEAVRHRVIRWSLYLKYLLSGEDGPFWKAADLTYGVNAGGEEFLYELAFLSPCDPFYTAEILLGEARSFWSWNIGRDGPPGADYYAPPRLLPLGNLLKFAYLSDGDPEDIQVVEEAIDRESETIDIPRIMEHGGRKLYRNWIRLDLPK